MRVCHNSVLSKSHLGSVMVRVRGTWKGHSEMVDRSKGGGRTVKPNTMQNAQTLLIFFCHPHTTHTNTRSLSLMRHFLCVKVHDL